MVLMVSLLVAIFTLNISFLVMIYTLTAARVAKAVGLRHRRHDSWRDEDEMILTTKEN